MTQKLIDGVLIDLTPEEEAERQSSASKPQSRTRTDVLVDLAAIDLKSIRALREGYQPKIDELDAQAAALRAEMATL